MILCGSCSQQCVDVAKLLETAGQDIRSPSVLWTKCPSKTNVHPLTTAITECLSVRDRHVRASIMDVSVNRGYGADASQLTAYMLIRPAMVCTNEGPIESRIMNWVFDCASKPDKRIELQHTSELSNANTKGSNQWVDSIMTARHR
jgi:hypothetical protein